jgi:2-alkyl-3-oxoalkanoate reductase
MRILVTGATGVLGRRVVPLLLAAGHSVTAIGRTLEARHALQLQGAAAIGVDLFDRVAVQAAVGEHDTVINLATHIPSSSLRMMWPASWRENDRIRREASNMLVDAALGSGASRFIQESYALAYPDSGDTWITEQAPLQPASYNRTILDAEAAAERFGKSGAPAVTLRFAAFYGHDAQQVADMLGYVRRGFAPLPGSPDTFISSVSHDDAAAAVVTALTVPTGVYNVSDDRPVTHREFVDSLAQAMGVRPPRLPPAWMTPLFGPVGGALARSIRLSNHALRQRSIWRPSLSSVREGWPVVIEQLRRHGRRSIASED